MKKLNEGKYYVANIGSDEMIAQGRGVNYVVKYKGTAYPSPFPIDHPEKLPDSGLAMVDVWIPSATGLTDGHMERGKIIYKDDIRCRACDIDLKDVGIIPEVESIKIADLYPVFALKRKTLSPATQKRYAHAIEGFCLLYLKKVDLMKATKADFVTWKERIRLGRPNAGSNNRVYGALHARLAFAKEEYGCKAVDALEEAGRF